MNKTFLSQFRNPGSEYRGAPFWAWNGKLEPEELRRQVRIMHRMGLGGFFMHSRVGLDTAYLGKDWMDCVAACVDEAEKLDMQAWLYDEDRWPSGAAGGLVTKNPKYRQRYLAMVILDNPGDLKWDGEVLGVFSAEVKDGAVANVERLAKGKKPEAIGKGRKVLAFVERVADNDSWFNGYTYLDTMNHEAVKEFIRVTHKAYRKKFGDAFGKRIPGIFTDEPNFKRHQTLRIDGQDAPCVPWTGALPKVFKQRYGYDLLDCLPELFVVVDGQTKSKVRWQYRDCLAHLFVDAFARQIGEWCDKHGLMHTGHVLAEGSLSSQSGVAGSCMRFYEYMQAPGMDLLTEHSREYDTAKQVSSMARQFGRRWRLTETYGCTGWDFNFAGHKALGDWQAAMGINLRCQHLSWYTMSGQAKRDYPASIFYQSPWWEHYRKVEDYFGRVHMAMSRGREVRDVLVIHPVESMWLVYAKGLEDEWRSLDKGFWQLRDTLLAANLDFDYGDEEVMSRHAKVGKDKQGAVLKVGQADYRVVVVPAMMTMRQSTLELLRKFKEAGGEIVFAGQPSGYVNGEESQDVIQFAGECTKTPAKGKKLALAVEVNGRRVSIADGEGEEIVSTLYCLREDKDAWYLFVINTGHELFGRKVNDCMVRDRTLSFDDVRIKLQTGTQAAPVELDLETGQVFETKSKLTGDGWSIQTSFPAIGSRLFTFSKKASRVQVESRPGVKTVSDRAIGGDQWTVQLSEPNVLVLDQPRYRIDGGACRKVSEILQVDQAVRDALSLPHRGGRMAQPWTRKEIKQPREVLVELAYEFNVKGLPGGPLVMAVECPESFDITLNGRSVDTDTESGWWVDPSLRTLRLDPADVCLGKNVLNMVCHYDEMHPGLEMAYLIGPFGVKLAGERLTLVEQPAKLKVGDWTRQGLPFYSGNVCYTKMIQPRVGKGQRLIVQVPEFRGVAVRVQVDGKEAGVIAWPPYELDVTDMVKSGQRVSLGLEVLGHRRNSHGPLHINERWPRWTGPGQYVESQMDGYSIVPCGLMGPPRLIVRK